MRVAELPPAACSGCFQSKPQMRHVDFEVAWDGPTIAEGVLGDDGEVAHTLTVAIDDMILCEECVCAAAAHVGFADPGALTGELEQLKESNQVLVERYRGLEEYVARLEAAVAKKPEPVRRPRAKAVA